MIRSSERFLRISKVSLPASWYEIFIIPRQVWNVDPQEAPMPMHRRAVAASHAAVCRTAARESLFCSNTPLKTSTHAYSLFSWTTELYSNTTPKFWETAYKEC